MTKEKVKYVLIAFGTLDLFGFSRTYESGLNILLTGLWGNLNLGGFTSVIPILIMALNSILVLSLILSGLLCIFKPKASFLIYYFQFPLRFIFVTLTFGFILWLPGLQIGSWTYKFVLAFVVGLEILRLIFNITSKKKYFGALDTRNS